MTRCVGEVGDDESEVKAGDLCWIIVADAGVNIELLMGFWYVPVEVVRMGKREACVGLTCGTTPLAGALSLVRESLRDRDLPSCDFERVNETDERFRNVVNYDGWYSVRTCSLKVQTEG